MVALEVCCVRVYLVSRITIPGAFGQVFTQSDLRGALYEQ